MNDQRQRGWWIATTGAILALTLGACSLRSPTPGFATPTPEGWVAQTRVLELVRDEINGDSETYAGAYIDNTTGDLVILVATDEAQATSTVRDLIPAGTPVVWRRVARSGAALQRIHDEIVTLWSQTGVDRINHVAIDTLTNTVAVSLPAPDEELAARIEARYGDAVRITLDPPADPI